MAGEISTTQTFADGDQVTSAKLNNLISQASFTASAITGTTLVVTVGKLKVGTITSAEMGAASVVTAALADTAVTTGKIFDGNVTTAKLADGAVTAAKISANSITFSRLSTSIMATEATMETETGSLLVTPDILQHSPRVAKAHGVVQLSVGSRSLKPNSSNVTSVAADSTSTTQVVLATNMGADNYTVLATWESNTADAQMVSIYDKTAGSFYIKHPVASANKFINFVCFGPY